MHYVRNRVPYEIQFIILLSGSVTTAYGVLSVTMAYGVLSVTTVTSSSLFHVGISCVFVLNNCYDMLYKIPDTSSEMPVCPP